MGQWLCALMPGQGPRPQAAMKQQGEGKGNATEQRVKGEAG
jgi:hypothetical protein